MKMVQKLAPHAAILIGNMYYVFWGIDRVNRSMNFIDNGFTKLLILLLILCSGAVDWPLLKNALRKLQKAKDSAPVYARLGLLGLNALLGAVILILMLIDLINEDLLIFLNEFVKILILLLSITALLNSLQLIARDRAIARYLAKRTAQRRPAPQGARPSAVRPVANAARSNPARPVAQNARPGMARSAANAARPVGQNARPSAAPRTAAAGAGRMPSRTPSAAPRPAGYGSTAARPSGSASRAASASGRPASAASRTASRAAGYSADPSRRSVSMPTRPSTRIPDRRN